MADQDLSKLKVAELRELLKEKGLNTVGNKQELIERLQAAVSESSGDLNEDELLNDDELDEEKSLLDSTHDDILKSPESAKSTSPETNTAPVPAKKISLKRNTSLIVPIIEKPSEEPAKAAQETEEGSGEPEKKIIKVSELTAKDRLELRAKKFGNSAVTSEGDSDRLQARAARFGITADKSPQKTGSTTSTPNLDLLKKRAERFGAVIVPELKKSELDEKLKKRQERFGSTTTETGKTPITAPTTTSSENAEKALKRLERFKQTA